MSGNIKVGGTWRPVSKLYAKVNVSGTSSWRSVSTGWVKVAGVWKKWYTALITDSFTRPNTGSLGSTDTGNLWSVLRGTWYTNGTQAVSDTAASSYPLAAIATGNSNVVVSASVGTGTGVSFWVTDANSWWASTSYSDQTPYTCGCGTCCNTCTHTGGSCGTTTVCNTCTHTGGSCGTTTTYSCPSGGTLSGSSCNVPGSSVNYLSLFGAGAAGQCAADGGTYSSPNCSFPGYSYAATATTTDVTCTNADCTACGSTIVDATCTNADCAACGSYTCGCSTCYSNNYYLQLLKSVSGTVSQATSNVSLSSAAAAIRVTTTGTQIVSQAYSDTALTTPLGSPITLTPTTPTMGTSHGIIKAPSAYNQQSTVDNFSEQ